jgi:hypothetical protein
MNFELLSQSPSRFVATRQRARVRLAQLCSSGLMVAVALGLAVAPVAAQSADASQVPPPGPAPSAALALVCQFTPGTLDPEALRTAIERELAVPVRRVETPEGTHLSITADSPSGVQLTFVRADGSTIERTVDVSNTGGHADETLALVAANLMRDEAADLLDALRAAQAEPPQPSAAPPAEPQKPEPLPLPMGCAPNNLRKIPLGLDVLPYVGMSSRDGTTVERKFSFNLFGGISGALRGAEIGGFVNLEAHSVCGVQFTVVANLVDGPVQGAQFGMVNWASGRVDGAQFGLVTGALGGLKGVQYGLVEFAGRDVTGAQFGLLNFGGASLTGAQFGLGNLALTQVQGAQFGLANVAGDTLAGAQFGLANVAANGASGAQIGLVNVSAAETRGLQLGLANISAKPMHGAMIGLVNTAETADAPIGLVNVLWKGRTQADIWATDFGLGAVGIVHGGRYLHNIYGFGMTSRHGRAVIAPVYGIGGRALETARFMVDVDLLGYGLFLRDDAQNELDDAFIGTLRVPIAYRFFPEFALYVSPALNVSVGAADNNLLHDPPLVGNARLTRAGATTEVRIWPGFTIGARFF